MESPYLQWAKEALSIEAQAIEEITKSLDHRFIDAVEALLQCRGRVVVMGMGKSGHIGRKLAATLASTGTATFFVHPAEAAHGDLGMILTEDAVILLSNSGESDEISAILPALKRKNVLIVAITAKTQSTLAQFANIVIPASVSQEACPLGLAPMASTTAVLALGDALAVALLKAKSFTPHDFALSHPAGSLGRKLLLRVSDIMHQNEELPFVLEHTPLKTAVVRMSEKGIGMLAITNDQGTLQGIFTDGDMRRLFETHDHFADLTINDVMQRHPITIFPQQLASEATQLMQQKKINGLLVVDEQQSLVGALNMHDLLKAGVV